MVQQIKKKFDMSVSGIQKIQISNTFPSFKTKLGGTMPSYSMAYLTLGKLNEKEDNVILICHAFSGDAQVAGNNKKGDKPGWWDSYVGPGLSIDTNKFFVIAMNIIGGCEGSTGPSSINKKTNKPFGMDFPMITIEDMVHAQVSLIQDLGIKKIFAVIGPSMGGMQTLAWSILYPKMIEQAIIIATCMEHSALQIAFQEIGRQAIITDPNWNNGNYYNSKRPEHGLSVARMVGHVTYMNEYSMRQKFGRSLSSHVSKEKIFNLAFSVESYLQYQGESFVKRFDPNSYLYITKAIDLFSFQKLQKEYSQWHKENIEFFVLSFSSDWLYPPHQARELVRTLKRHNKVVSYVNLESPYGHDSFLLKAPRFQKVLKNYLETKHQSKK